MQKGTLKVNSNQVMWWNGQKWLLKETCADEAAALALKEELEARNE